MRSLFQRRARFFGLLLAAGTLLALTADTASAQRRGRVGVGTGYGYYPGYGYGYGGYGYGNYGYGSGWGLGSPSYTTAGWGSAYYGYPSSNYNYSMPYYTSSSSGYWSSPSYTAGTYGTGYAANGCCDPCAAGTVAYGPSNNGGVVQTSGYTPEVGVRIVEVNAGGAQTAGIQQGAVIVDVDGRRVQTVNDLQTALRSGQNGQVKLTFIDAKGQRTTRDVAVKNNTIGVSVVETPVSVPLDPNRNNNNNGTTPNRPNGTIPAPLPSTIPPPTTTPSTTIPSVPEPSTTPTRPPVKD